MTNFTEFEISTIDKGWKFYNKPLKYDKNSIKKIRVCIYLRKSTEDIKDNSLKLQLDEIKKFINSINYNYDKRFLFYYEECDVFQEDNVSGMQGRLRPEFDKMLSIIESNPGYYGVCFVYKMDRFSRKLEDTLKYISLLKSFKCVLKALDFDDNGDPTSDLLRNMLGVVAQYHAQNSALTSIKGTIKKVEEHKSVGLLPLGLITEKAKLCDFNAKGASKIVIDEDKAFIIKEIFEKFSSGMSIKEIEKYLLSKGYTKNDGTFIKYQQIYYILRNKRYNGTYVYADPNKKRYYKYDNGVKKPEYYEEKNAFPKIISDELFGKVQLMIDSRKKYRKYSSEYTSYLLTGILYCSCCGKSLHGWSRPKYKGKKYYDYVCTTHKENKEKCSTKRINKVYLDNLAINLIVLIVNQLINLTKENAFEIINRKLEKKNSELTFLNKEINTKKQKINKLIDRMILDEKRIKIYEIKIQEIENEILLLEEKLNKSLIILKNLEKKLSSILTNITITREMLINNFEDTRILISLIIEKIYLSNDEIIFTLKTLH